MQDCIYNSIVITLHKLTQFIELMCHRCTETDHLHATLLVKRNIFHWSRGIYFTDHTSYKYTWLPITILPLDINSPLLQNVFSSLPQLQSCWITFSFGQRWSPLVTSPHTSIPLTALCDLYYIISYHDNLPHYLQLHLRVWLVSTADPAPPLWITYPAHTSPWMLKI